MKTLTTMAVGILMAGISLLATDSEKLLNSKAGIYDVKYENGCIVSFMVIGKQKVPENLRKVPGRAAEFARDKAENNAHAVVTDFLINKCVWVKNAKGQLAVRETTAKASSGVTVIKLTQEQKQQAIKKYTVMLLNRCSGMSNQYEYTWVGVWDPVLYQEMKN